MAVDTAVTPVSSTEVAGNVAVAVQDMSVWGMFMHADMVVKAVMILLLLASIWCWAIMIEKYLRFKAIKLQTGRFEREFWSASAIDSFYDRARKKAKHPIAQVFSAGMDELLESKRDVPQSSGQFRTSLRERISSMMHIQRNREVERLESGLGFLATVGSAAPFVGLFGTVWGIMNSFTSIAAAKNITLAVVAPGIAEALLATAIGLFAAIPAVVGYNKFSAELDKMDARLSDFTTEFNAMLSRQLDSEGR